MRRKLTRANPGRLAASGGAGELRDARVDSTFTRHPHTVPLAIPHQHPTILIRRDSFERVGLTRTQLDEWLNLTAEEFRVEAGLVVVGPLVGEESLDRLIAELEGTGLAHFEDFFDLSGNWPAWLRLYAGA